jgi:mannose/fructose/N-acetylgalactosamine-specific phosphotransferase system component IID
VKQKRVDKEIRTGDLLVVFWRAFLIQASWSFERMQSLGFAYALEPVLRKLYPDQAEYESRLRLHMDYFNTQPYLASFILGAAVRLEQDRASGSNAAADVQGMKASLMGPLGALGDSFFWGAAKPLSAVVAIALLMTGSLWAPLAFLALYNVCHVGIRAAVLFRGYASGGNAVDLMDRYRFTKIAKRFKVVTLCVLGGILGVLPAWLPEFKLTLPIPEILLALSGMVFTLLLIVLLRKGGSPVKLMLGLAVFCLVLAFAGVI